MSGRRQLVQVDGNVRTDANRSVVVVPPPIEKIDQVLRGAGEPLTLEEIRDRLLTANPALVRSVLGPSRLQGAMAGYPTLFVRTPDDRWTSVVETRRHDALRALQTAVTAAVDTSVTADASAVVPAAAVPPFVTIDLEATG